MKKVFKILSFFLAIFLQKKYLNDYKIDTDLLASLITFLSIVFGFYIASFSIFATSRYVKDLYSVEDKNDKNSNLLLTLIGNYKFALTISLITIAYLLVIQILLIQGETKQLLLSETITSPFLGIVILNFYYSYSMLSVLTKIIIQEAKKTEQ